MYTVVIFDVTFADQVIKSKAEGLLSREEYERYEKYLHKSDALLFLYGRYLSRLMIAHASNKQPNEIMITSKAIGEKPSVLGNSIEFSISHSGSYVAAAVSNYPVGVDVQIHNQIDFDIFDTFLNKEEIRYKDKSPECFYQLWTAIESLAKITGLGFNEALRERTPIFSNSLDIYCLNSCKYFISTLENTKISTLALATDRPVTFTKLPVHEASKHAYLEGIAPFAVIYSAAGSTDSAV